MIAQSSDVLRVDSCDDLLSKGSLNRKDLFEGPDQLFVLCLYFSDNELCSSSSKKQKSGV